MKDLLLKNSSIIFFSCIFLTFRLHLRSEYKIFSLYIYMKSFFYQKSKKSIDSCFCPFNIGSWTSDVFEYNMTLSSLSTVLPSFIFFNLSSPINSFFQLQFFQYSVSIEIQIRGGKKLHPKLQYMYIRSYLVMPKSFRHGYTLKHIVTGPTQYTPFHRFCWGIVVIWLLHN